MDRYVLALQMLVVIMRRAHDLDADNDGIPLAWSHQVPEQAPAEPHDASRGGGQQHRHPTRGPGGSTCICTRCSRESLINPTARANAVPWRGVPTSAWGKGAAPVTLRPRGSERLQQTDLFLLCTHYLKTNPFSSISVQSTTHNTEIDL